jgi:hypothetical protein
MEIIGGTSGLIVTLTQQIALLSSVFDWKAANDSARTLLRELRHIHEVLRIIPDVLSLEDSPVQQTLIEVLEELENSVSGLLTLNYPPGKGKTPVVRRLKWALRQEQTDKIRFQIDQSKATLTLLLSLHQAYHPSGLVSEFIDPLLKSNISF